MPGVCRRFQCAAVAGLLVLAAESSEAQPAVRHVLLLQSFDRGNMPDDHLTGNFRVDLGQRTGQAVNVVQIVVGSTAFVGAPTFGKISRTPVPTGEAGSSRQIQLAAKLSF